MPRPDAAKMLATNLANLQHPDGTVLRAIGLSPLLMQAAGDTQAVEQINKLAFAHAEAIIHTLETNGYILSHRDDPKPVNQPGAKIVTISCKTCSTQLAMVPIDDHLHASIPGGVFIAMTAERRPECPHA